MLEQKKILIVGGGIGGMAAAIRMSFHGAKVDLIDLDPAWRVYGAGITITGPTLRAYRDLGLLDAVKDAGAISAGIRLFRFDGLHLADLVEPPLENGLPATGGIMRPKLHQIMQERVRELGVSVRLAVTVDALTRTNDRIEASLSDGTKATYDLVVGADSINSRVRELAFPHMGPPQMTGQGCWRISIRKPPELERGEFYVGHANPAGITLCGPDQVYMWMLTPHVAGSPHLNDKELFETLKGLLADFGGNIGWIRDHMNPADWVNYRPLAARLQPAPWHTDNIVLIGDAVHATTPHLASGAGIAVESAIVLADELERHDDIAAALAAFQTRRFDRCRDVIETSLTVGKLQLDQGPPHEQKMLLEAALARLNQTY